MLVYIPVPSNPNMPSLTTPAGQHLPAFQYQQTTHHNPHHHTSHHHQQHTHVTNQATLVRNSATMVCGPQPLAHHQPPMGYHQTPPQMNSGTGYAIPSSTGGNYCPMARLHRCSIHSFVCTNPNFQHYQVAANCIGHHHHQYPNFVASNTTGSSLMATPSPSQTGTLFTAGSQLYTIPTPVNLSQQMPNPPQATAAPAPNRSMGAHTLPVATSHHHSQVVPSMGTQPAALLGPFPHAYRSSTNIEVLGRGVYRPNTSHHLFSRVRANRNSSNIPGNRRTGTSWRGNQVNPGPPPSSAQPLPQLAPGAQTSYNGVLMNFLALLTPNSYYHSMEAAIPPESPDPENYEALLHLAERLGEAKPRGLSKSVIDQLPSYRYSGDQTDSKQTNCVICMNDFDSKLMLRVLPCLHEFHAKCVDRWLKTNRTCPICRGDAGDYVKETPMAE